jgi:biopolymer transport protein ExbD
VENEKNFIIEKNHSMAQMELQLSETKKTKRKLHPSLRIDMTPMVDLGFLLITFFIFTTTMSEKKAMKLYMPTDKGTPSPAPESKVLTILLSSNNKVYAYEGKFEDAIKQNTMLSTTYNVYDGIGKLIRDKQERLQMRKKEGRNDLIFLIKPTKQATYRNVVDALDEATINDVKKYMVVEPSIEENLYCLKLSQ